MAYLYVRHRGKHLLPVGVLVLCNKVEHFSWSAPAGLSGASSRPMVQARAGEHRCGARGLCGGRPRTRRVGGVSLIACSSDDQVVTGFRDFGTNQMLGLIWCPSGTIFLRWLDNRFYQGAGHGGCC